MYAVYISKKIILFGWNWGTTFSNQIFDGTGSFKKLKSKLIDLWPWCTYGVLLPHPTHYLYSLQNLINKPSAPFILGRPLKIFKVRSSRNINSKRASL